MRMQGAARQPIRVVLRHFCDLALPMAVEHQDQAVIVLVGAGLTCEIPLITLHPPRKR